MKLSLSVGLLAIASVSAFAPANSGVRSSMQLNSVGRADASEAIKAALEASKKFGASSPEARMAWETVEEIDSADTSAAMGGSLDTECLVEEEASKACMEYSEKLEALNELVQKQKPIVDQLKTMTTELQKVKLAASSARPAKDSPELRSAVKTAKEAVEKYGASSSEAAVAWEAVEEIAAADMTPALGGSLTDECLVEALEACEALDALNNALSLDASSSRYSG